jgi:hypothetical protein
MSCVACGLAVTTFQRWTVGIATEVDFFYPRCNSSKAAAALWSNYVLETTETNESSSRQRIDKCELNWRLIVACELLGESQVGGSIIGFLLDLTTDAFRSNRTPMELQLGVLEQV